MAQNKQRLPGKSIGQGMLIASLSMGLIALTFFFDGWLGRQTNPNLVPQSSENADGLREVVLERNRQGHYVAGGSINDVAVTFLLDTGATDVAIPESIARQAQLPRGYEGRASTANGVITVYSTHIDELRLGNIRLHDIEASITPSMAGDTILLGMSALQQVEFTQRGGTLTLRQYIFD